MKTIEVKVPVFAESITEGTILTWNKQVGDFVKKEEIVVEVETDKVLFEVPSPEAGKIIELKYAEGDVILSEAIIAIIDTEAQPEQAVASQVDTSQTANTKQASEHVPVPTNAQASANAVTNTANNFKQTSPTSRALLEQNNLNKSQITGSGNNGRIMPQDVQSAIANANIELNSDALGRIEKRVPMSRIRTKIAERLLDATQSTAMLTTFNEINMKPVMDARKKYKDQFEQAHGVKLGFMSFFVKAATEALKRFPAVNASIDGNDIVYHGYFDVGIAVSTERGLMVPILRDVQNMSLADIERTILDFGMRGRERKITLEELTGGTFSITNGGVFGSLLSTPIINPPQSGILGMHSINEKPVVINGEIVIRPMMYIALSYDHRIIDGKDAVSFLKCLKEFIEEPFRLLLEL